MVTRQPTSIPMAKAAPHGPGEIVSLALIGWYTSFHLYRVRKAHSKKEDRSILWGIDLSLSQARHKCPMVCGLRWWSARGPVLYPDAVAGADPEG